MHDTRTFIFIIGLVLLLGGVSGDYPGRSRWPSLPFKLVSHTREQWMKSICTWVMSTLLADMSEAEDGTMENGMSNIDSEAILQLNRIK